MRHGTDEDSDYDEDEPYVLVERRSNGASSFLVGLAVGAGIALLYAPHSGEDTRRELKRRARRAAGAAREAAGDLSDTVVDRYEQAKRGVEDRFESARRALEMRKHQATEAFRAGREAAQQARLDLEARIAETKANYRPNSDATRGVRRSPAASGDDERNVTDREPE
jgi:gas vesicle protein